MHPIDLAVITVYIAGCTLLGIRLGRRSSGLEGYFLGDRGMPAWAVMISIVATETSTATFLSVPGVAYNGDFTYLQLALGYLVGRVVVATLLLPPYFRREIFTAYQVLNVRFGGATRTTASVMFLVSRTLGDGLRLFLAGKVLQILYLSAAGEPGADDSTWVLPAAIVAVGLATMIYTYLGGMKAVIWTDVIQFGVYMLGAACALAILLGNLPGGLGEVLERGTGAGKFRMFDFDFDLTKPYTFWAGLIGGMVVNTATHGADQMMVQRYLSARSERQAAGAVVASGFVVLAQFAFFLLIGVSLWVYFQDYPPALSGGRGLRRDEEFPYFIVHNLPIGVLGLVIAAIFSAAMSTLSSSLNASASSTVNDLIRPMMPNLGEARLLRVSKILTLLWGLAQMAVAFFAIRLTDNVVNNALAIASFVTGIVLGLFLLGILTRRVGQAAALVALVMGLLVVSYAALAPKLPEPYRSAIYPFEGAIAWPWYALIGSSTVFAVGWLASWALPDPSARRKANTTEA